jgi:hypothetical protein
VGFGGAGGEKKKKIREKKKTNHRGTEQKSQLTSNQDIRPGSNRHTGNCSTNQ